MAPGFANINDLTVIQTTQGLAQVLLSQFADAKTRGVVVGYDGRYNSRSFARYVAMVFLLKGIKVYLFPDVIPTPLVASAVTRLHCVSGVMITASHNPKDDNGYKLYWENGCQIVSPLDALIAESIERNLEPWADLTSVDPDTHTLVSSPYDFVVSKYLSDILAWRFCHIPITSSCLKITYTAMHGVGAKMVEEAFKVFNLPPFHPVAAQILPDPEFPTVAFPNPEEGKGALELAFQSADSINSPLVIANDPDADRLAVAEKVNGSWEVFTGDQIGILLAHWVVTQYLFAHPTADRSKLVVLNTTVSSKMLKKFALQEGLYYEETLTGFKWLGTKAEELRKQGYTFLFAYEEAIGFMIGDVCLDKDGVRGAAVFAEMASTYYSEGRNVYAQLQFLYSQYGYFKTKNSYFFNYDPSKLRPIFDVMFNNNKYHEACGRFKIKGIRDLTTPGFDNMRADNRPLLPTSSSPMITFYFENGAIATLRGSGTEPKLKYYVELAGEEPELVQTELDNVVEELIKHFLQPKRWNLQPPSD